MLIKILQLNIWKGKLFDNLLPYLEKYHFDILQFQEVAGPGVSFSKSDNFQELQQPLSKEYIGLRTKAYTTTYPGAYDGVATFFHVSFSLLEEKVIYLAKQLPPIDNDYLESIQNTSNPFFEDLPRSALSSKVEKLGKVFWVINTQLAWNPSSKDTPKKIAAAKVLEDFLTTLKDPFVLTGDFNVDSDTKIVRGFEEYAQNLNKKYHVTNTLNGRFHRAKHLFPPGLAVDFIMPKKGILVKEFEVLDNDFSDHLGLSATVEI